jgi:acetyl-CoA carboxylase carboxyltransferase component
MTVAEKIELLKSKRAQALEMGGEERIAKQKKKGKLTARERIDLLFDKGTFREVDMLVKHRCTNFGLENAEITSDAVIVGHGKVNGRVVFAFSQDFTSRGGSLGEMHASKICEIMDLAVKAGAPVVGLNDWGGARVEEGAGSSDGEGQEVRRETREEGKRESEQKEGRKCDRS